MSDRQPVDGIPLAERCHLSPGIRVVRHQHRQSLKMPEARPGLVVARNSLRTSAGSTRACKLRSCAMPQFCWYANQRRGSTHGQTSQGGHCRSSMRASDNQSPTVSCDCSSAGAVRRGGADIQASPETFIAGALGQECSASRPRRWSRAASGGALQVHVATHSHARPPRFTSTKCRRR